jgi:hypothetical protein
MMVYQETFVQRNQHRICRRRQFGGSRHLWSEISHGRCRRCLVIWSSVACISGRWGGFQRRGGQRSIFATAVSTVRRHAKRSSGASKNSFQGLSYFLCQVLDTSSRWMNLHRWHGSSFLCHVQVASMPGPRYCVTWRTLPSRARLLCSLELNASRVWKELISSPYRIAKDIDPDSRLPRSVSFEGIGDGPWLLDNLVTTLTMTSTASFKSGAPGALGADSIGKRRDGLTRTRACASMAGPISSARSNRRELT